MTPIMKDGRVNVIDYVYTPEAWAGFALGLITSSAIVYVIMEKPKAKKKKKTTK